MNFIWATRGRTWGFRFLRTAGLADPLRSYRPAFSESPDQPEFAIRVGDVVALRFQDPGGRCDESGRTISHDFLIFRPEADQVQSATQGRDLVWPLVGDEFDEMWDQDDPSLHDF